MRHRIGLAVVCLHISAALYVLIGFVVFALCRLDLLPVAIGMLVFCFAIAIGVEAVAWGLRRRKRWAWITALCLFVLYVQSVFLPLGVLGLLGLLDGGSRAVFGFGDVRGAEPATASDPAASGGR
ncbi:hypothetical protein R5W24_006545 [Gemmata sp. JC717]|uniref:hypothetical protein n=1 Tax=Gemmata algarum TaxID=2975278 RepID=UPI0021BAF6BD|nr:hypothetical protein [Gemmata algarum]MDY3557356.1 hypothetical protein [Gemmata algarum]